MSVKASRYFEFDCSATTLRNQHSGSAASKPRAVTSQTLLRASIVGVYGTATMTVIIPTHMLLMPWLRKASTSAQDRARVAPSGSVPPWFQASLSRTNLAEEKVFLQGSNLPRPSIYPLLDPKMPIIWGHIYPYLRAQGGSWYSIFWQLELYGWISTTSKFRTISHQFVDFMTVQPGCRSVKLMRVWIAWRIMGLSK